MTESRCGKPCDALLEAVKKLNQLKQVAGDFLCYCNCEDQPYLRELREAVFTKEAE